MARRPSALVIGRPPRRRGNIQFSAVVDANTGAADRGMWRVKRSTVVTGVLARLTSLQFYEGIHQQVHTTLPS